MRFAGKWQMRTPVKPLPFGEFVTLLALQVSIIALSTDIMLPALDAMGRDLAIAAANDTQLIISSLFIGFAAGQLIVGPLSDKFGRRPVIMGGYGIFLLGCLLALVAQDLTTMIMGRVLQGLGAAGPRVVSISLVRDCHGGRAMARIMSVMMTVFIMVPTVAPAIGQGIHLLAGWRWIFLLLLVVALFTLAWFAIRQPETLLSAKRRRLSLPVLYQGSREALGNRTVLGYTLCTGLITGAFLAYLATAPQIYRTVYGIGDEFPLYFAVAVLAIGTGTIVNSRSVMRHGMRLLAFRALLGWTGAAALFLPLVPLIDGAAAFPAFMAWLMLTFFCVGILFGNLNALAMEPLGHMAGLGAALVGFISTAMSVGLGWFIGQQFDGGILFLVAGFLCAGLGALAVMVWTERGWVSR